MRVAQAGAANQCETGLEIALVLFKKRHKILRCDFLLALDDDGDVDRQRTRHGFPGPAGFDEGHQLALVVFRAARDDDFSPVGMRGNSRLERRTMPKIERIDRLHVVMTVEHHMRSPSAVSLAVGPGDDARMTRRPPDLPPKPPPRDIPR